MLHALGVERADGVPDGSAHEVRKGIGEQRSVHDQALRRYDDGGYERPVHPGLRGSVARKTPQQLPILRGEFWRLVRERWRGLWSPLTALFLATSAHPGQALLGRHALV